MSRRSTYVDIHILQDVPPANINRDDSGTPKQATYGGIPRLRVSSQAWKRATRLKFRETMPLAETGVRTRRLLGFMVKQLQTRGMQLEEAERYAALALSDLGITPSRREKKADHELSYLLFFGRSQLDGVADEVVRIVHEDGADVDAQVKAMDVKGALGTGHPLDVALFGRMVADLADLNVDAAVQVAHALSTHGAQTQFDYFTAVDDENEAAETGAGMIGVVEFNSATMYRFATVDMGQLEHNLADSTAAAEALGVFLRAFVLSMPTGHQTSFAARTRPSLVAVVVRGDQPVNLVSAFERPIRPGNDGMLAPSMRALAETYSTEVVRWGDQPLAVAANYTPAPSAGAVEHAFGASSSLDEVIGTATTAAVRGNA